MVLEGMVPVLTQTPPTTARDSTTATRFRILEAATAARCPEGPEPMMTRSYLAALMYVSPEGKSAGSKYINSPTGEDQFVGTLSGIGEPRFEGAMNFAQHSGLLVRAGCGAACCFGVRCSAGCHSAMRLSQSAVGFINALRRKWNEVGRCFEQDRSLWIDEAIGMLGPVLTFERIEG